MSRAWREAVEERGPADQSPSEGKGEVRIGRTEFFLLTG